MWENSSNVVLPTVKLQNSKLKPCVFYFDIYLGK